MPREWVVSVVSGLFGTGNGWRWADGQTLQDAQQISELRAVAVGRQHTESPFGDALVPQLANVHRPRWTS